MKKTIVRLKDSFIEFFNIGQAIEPDSPQQDFLSQVRQAHRDWQIALNNFNYCTDQDFIDYSIYNIEAAEKKYVYLLKRARKEKIAVNIPVSDIPDFDSYISGDN